MIVLSWNCRGLGNLRAVPALKDMSRSHHPVVIFLSETLAHTGRVEEIKVQLGYDCLFVTDREGRGWFYNDVEE